MKILFFSRGRGHGHAVPDMAISAALCAQAPETDIRFASYATGAATFRAAGHSVIDLNQPEINSYVATMLACEAAIRRERPTLVVAHEEFAALVAARLHGVPAVYMAAWLPSAGSVQAESLQYAQTIIVIERPGIFPVPPEACVKPVYTGPIVRPVKFTVDDRAALRAELGWPASALGIVVVPGGFATDAKSPIADLVFSAFRLLPQESKRLVWIASADYPEMSAKFVGAPNIEVTKFYAPIERLLAAADLVITKGTYGITYDAAAVGVPSLSLSHGHNRIDDQLVPRIRSNVALIANALDPETLAEYIRMVLAGPRRQPLRPSPGTKTAVDLAASYLLAALQAADESGSRK